MSDITVPREVILDSGAVIRPAVLMAFEPNTQEARDLARAVGFLLTLIAFLDELIEQSVPADADVALHQECAVTRSQRACPISGEDKHASNGTE
ncbi:MAG: hypothetical protein ACLPWS_21110 [Rhodomicrobium sp.]